MTGTTLEHLWTTQPVWHVPEGWRQGRGAWGGLVAGQVMVAAGGALADQGSTPGGEASGGGVREGLVPRSVHIGMLGPVPSGDVDVSTDIIRQSSSMTAVNVTLAVDGNTLTEATVVYGVARQETPISEYKPGGGSASSAGPEGESAPSTTPSHALASGAPQVSAQLPDVTQPVEFIEIGPPLAPEFTPHLRFAPKVGFPFQGSEQMATSGWVSLPADATDRLSPAVLVALVDAWWTAGLAALSADDGGMPPIGTLDFMATLPEQPLAGQENVWEHGLWYSSEVLVGADGYLTEVATLSAASGEVLVHNTQLIAVGRGPAKDA